MMMNQWHNSMIHIYKNKRNTLATLGIDCTENAPSSSYQNIISVKIKSPFHSSSNDVKKKYHLLKMNTTASTIENKAKQYSNNNSCNNSTQKVQKKYPNINDYSEESTVFLKRRSTSRTNKMISDGLIFIPNTELVPVENVNSPQLSSQKMLQVKSKSVTNYNKKRFNLTSNRAQKLQSNNANGTDKILARVRMLKQPLMDYTVKHQEINEKLDSLSRTYEMPPISRNSDELDRKKSVAKKSEFVSRLAHAKETSIKHLIEPGHEFATSKRTSYSDFYELKDQAYQEAEQTKYFTEVLGDDLHQRLVGNLQIVRDKAAMLQNILAEQEKIELKRQKTQDYFENKRVSQLSNKKNQQQQSQRKLDKKEQELFKVKNLIRRVKINIDASNNKLGGATFY